MIPGFLFNDDSTISYIKLIKFIKRKIWRLWLLYFKWNAIFTILNNVFIRMNLYTDNANYDTAFPSIQNSSSINC